MTRIALALLLSACLIPGGCGGKSPTSEHGSVNPDVVKLANIVCDRMSSCQTWYKDRREECLDRIVGSVGFVVGESLFTSCIAGIACADLQRYAPGDAYHECSLVDHESFTCDAGVMKYCDVNFSCTTVSCSLFCRSTGGTFTNCVSTPNGKRGCGCEYPD